MKGFDVMKMLFLWLIINVFFSFKLFVNAYEVSLLSGKASSLLKKIKEDKLVIALEFLFLIMLIMDGELTNYKFLVSVLLLLYFCIKDILKFVQSYKNIFYDKRAYVLLLINIILFVCAEFFIKLPETYLMCFFAFWIFFLPVIIYLFNKLFSLLEKFDFQSKFNFDANKFLIMRNEDFSEVIYSFLSQDFKCKVVSFKNIKMLRKALKDIDSYDYVILVDQTKSHRANLKLKSNFGFIFSSADVKVDSYLSDGQIFVNKDDANLLKYKSSYDNKTCNFSLKSASSFKMINLNVSKRGASFDVRYKKELISFKTKVTDENLLTYLLCGILFLFKIGVDKKRIVKLVKNY